MQRLGRTIAGVLASLVGSLALHLLFGSRIESCGMPAEATTELGTPAGEIDIDTSGPSAGGGGAPPAPEPPAPTPKPEKQAPRTPPRTKQADPIEPAEAEPPLPALPTPDETEQAVAAAPLPTPTPGAGSGDPNGLAAQRGRLGEAATCTDPVAGTWKATFYDRGRGQWYEFTLHITRDGAALGGTIQSRFWLGSRSSPRSPTSCAETPLYAVVTMPARGAFGEGRVRFGSSSWSLEHLYCGPSVQYSPDRFAGTIDAAKNEFQSIVTDGLNLIDQPLLLRRTGCTVP